MLANTIIMFSIFILLLLSNEVSSNAITKKNLTVSMEDSSMYSVDFVNELDSNFQNIYSNIALEDDYLILDKNDTVYFPTKPEIGRIYDLKSSNKMWISELTIERINQTSISFKVAFTDRLKYTFVEKGIATLKPSFMLSSETEDINGELYYLVYIEEEGKRNIAIRLGVDKSTNNLLLARIAIKGIDRCSIIELDKLPTYREDSNYIKSKELLK